jgi:hypothetical protein
LPCHSIILSFINNYYKVKRKGSKTQIMPQKFDIF